MSGAAQAADEFERFEFHHKAKNNKFADWKLAFYTWVRNWKERRGRLTQPDLRPMRMTTMQSEPSSDDRDHWLARDNGL
jgi:hypothetical protein